MFLGVQKTFSEFMGFVAFRLPSNLEIRRPPPPFAFLFLGRGGGGGGVNGSLYGLLNPKPRNPLKRRMLLGEPLAELSSKDSPDPKRLGLGGSGVGGCRRGLQKLAYKVSCLLNPESVNSEV